MSDTLTLPDELTIQTVSVQLAPLREAVDQAKDSITIDAQALESVDTAGVQLLLAVVKELEKRGCELSWNAVPTILSETARTLGAVSLLKLAP